MTLEHRMSPQRTDLGESEESLANGTDFKLTQANPFGEPPDFSLVLGGPMYQLLRKTHMEGDHLELLYRRIFFFTGIAWLPLLLLVTIGPFAGSAGRLAFLHDVEVHV